MRHFLLLFFLFMIPLSASTVLSEEVEIDAEIGAVKFHDKKDGIEVVQVHLSKMVDPIYFAIPDEKPRLVFDFYSTDYAQELPRRIMAGGEFVSKIRLGVHHDERTKTRLVVDLMPFVDVEVERRFADNGLVFEIVLTRKENMQTMLTAPDEKSFEKENDAVHQDTEKVDVEPTGMVSAAPVKKRGGKEDRVSIPENEDLDFHEAPLGPQDKIIEHPKVSLEKVTFERTTNQKEMILFRLKGFQTPVIFSPEGEEIRVVCEFLNASLGKSVVRQQLTGGDFIKKIKVSKRDDTSKVRVVLDLDSQYNYDLKQVLFKEDNLFVVIISALGKK